MKLLDANELDYIELDKRTYDLSKSYYEKGYVQLLDIQKIEKYYSIKYIVYAIVEVSGHMNEVTFQIDDYQNVETYSCDCPWAQYQVCAHAGAVIYMISKMQFDKFPYHFQKTTKALQEFLKVKQEQREQAEREYQQKVIKGKMEEGHKLISKFQKSYENKLGCMAKTGSYSLFPTFSMNSECMLIDFRIGGEKTYVIRNLHMFLRSIDQNEYVTYGKYLSVYHNINSFDRLSQKWIHFMRKYVDNDSYYYGNRYYDDVYFDHNRQIKVDEENIADFFEEFKDEKLPQIRLSEKEFKYPIEISDEQDYYVVSQIGEVNLIQGRDGFYEFKNHRQIIRYPVSSINELEDFIEELSESPLYLDKKDFADFSHYVLSPHNKILDINYKNMEVVPFTYSAPTYFKVYGDLLDDITVVFHATCLDENKQQVEVIQNSSIPSCFHADLIKVMLEDAADYVDENHHAYFNLDKPETYELIHSGTETLAKYCDVFVSEELKKLGKKTSYNLQIGVSLGNNLLEVNLESEDFDVNEVDNILRAYHKKKKYYRLKSGLMIHLESNELDELDSLIKDYNLKSQDFHDGKLQLENYRALSLDKNLDDFQYIQVEKDDSLKQYINGFENMENRFDVSPQYKEILRPYQVTGVEWLLTLYQYNLNGILADDMGLGKTLQVIALLDSIRDKNRHSLVVCPASLIYNWEDEISRFSDTLNCVSITGTKEQRRQKIHQYAQYDLLITSYDYIRRDIDEYADCNFEYVILDEAQYIKNQKTKNAESVKSLKSKHRLALSGTPIENSLAELWSIFDFLMPGYLFNYHYFRSEYETVITLNENEEVSKKLKAMVSPFILRRTKKEVLKELPDKVDHKYVLDFNAEERKLYLANLATVSKEMQAKMKENNFDRIAIFAMLTRLRQLCCDPRLIYENIAKPSTKVQATIDLIKVMVENKKKILLFSAFTSLLDLVSDELAKDDISYYMLTGSTNKEERRKLVNDYQNDDTSVFLISLKAGGTGLNLTAAEVVIHIDPWWNISAQNQATDRAHRIGQNANVQVYRMIMKDSIEEKILKMQERKANLADSFVEGNDGSLSKMSKEEILDLFER